MKAIVAGLALTLVAAPLFSQSDASPITERRRIASTWGGMRFKTASLQQNNSGSNAAYSNNPLGGGNVYKPDGGRFSAKNLPLITYLGFAYKLTSSQAASISAQLPEWAQSARYDIEARSADRNATKDQMRSMVQALLADRFQLAIRTENRALPAYRLVVADPPKTGPQLLAHSAHDTACSTRPSSRTAGIFPKQCGGISQLPPGNPADVRFAARNVDIDLLTGFLSGLPGEIDRPVVNRTGLSGAFDFSLEWAPAPKARLPLSSPETSPLPTGPALRDALAQQLGLRLEPEDESTLVYVIDSISLPSEN